MTAPVLRPYQREAIEAVVAARKSGIRRMVVCLPTGAGKTVIFSELARLANKRLVPLIGEFARASGRQAVSCARRNASVVTSAAQRAHRWMRMCSSRRCGRAPDRIGLCSPG